MDELRTAPQNIEAEQGVLAAMMLGDERAIDEIINYLVPEDFYREAHRVIYGHMQELHHAGKAIDNITLIDSLRNANKLEDIGGIAYITSIAASVPTTANIKYHADIVRDKSRLRRMIAAGTEIARMGYEPDTDNIQELLDKAEAKMLNVAQSNNNTEFTPINSIVLNISNLVTELSDQKNLLIGIPTNIRDLDIMTSGLQPSDFIILAARPCMGKTALALNIAANVAIRGRNKDGNRLTVAIFSLEMSKNNWLTVCFVPKLLLTVCVCEQEDLKQKNLTDFG
ncbi:MAG: hypothetical protein KBS60_00635, partial [Phascolarctobacterium sp.]|nr:hypothetical protein [Candidatus Phascolarctobacterium caballi]